MQQLKKIVKCNKTFKVQNNITYQLVLSDMKVHYGMHELQELNEL